MPFEIRHFVETNFYLRKDRSTHSISIISMALVRLTLQLHIVFLFLADVMKSKGANTVIAVDVGSEYPAELTNYGDHLSGWWLLWKKWNPFGEKIYVSAMWYGIVLCCAVLCCAVLCCAVLCCAVLCCAVLCCAVLCCAVLCCAVLCCAVLCCAVLCCAVLCCAVLCCAMAKRKRVHELFAFSKFIERLVPNSSLMELWGRIWEQNKR